MRVFRAIQIVLTIILILGFTLWFWTQIHADKETKQDKSVRATDLETQQIEAAIEKVYSQFEKYIREDQFANAYELMTPSYRDHNTLKMFRFQFCVFQKSEKYKLSSKREVIISRDEATLSPQGGWDSVALKLKKIEGKWYFTGEVLVFKD